MRVKDLPKNHPARVRRRKRIAVWTFVFIMASALLAPFSGFLLSGNNGAAIAQEEAAATNPRADMWRAVKGGVGGYSSIKGPETGVLNQSGGVEWANFRRGPIVKYAPWALAGMLLLILLYHLIHGRNRLMYRPSGVLVKRWTWFERLVHWTTAISFIILAITGLSMMLGRTLLLPLFSGMDGGKAAYAAWAQLSIQLHNVVGPILSIGILLMIVMWIWHNFPAKEDWNWIKSGGGIIGNKHPSAGRMNFGEKVWFWIICTFGLAVVISGLLMVAPSFPSIEALLPITVTRGIMQDANAWHVIAGIIWMVVAIGHIYIGTAGTEGAFQGMSTGYVTAEWAEQHHRSWFNKLRREGRIVPKPNRYAREAQHRRPTQSRPYRRNERRPAPRPGPARPRPN